jgi:membrane protease YdiL (CAAX protease family)
MHRTEQSPPAPTGEVRAEAWHHRDDPLAPGPPGRFVTGVRALGTAVVLMAIHHLVLQLMAWGYIAYFRVRYPEVIQKLLLECPDPNAFALKLAEVSDLSTVASLLAMPLLIILYVTIIVIKHRRHDPIVLWEHVSRKQAFHAFIVLLGTVGITQLWVMLLASFDIQTAIGRRFQEYMERMQAFAVDQETSIWNFVAVAVLVPIAEELLFRGLVHGAMRRAFRPPVAITLTTVLFAVFHLDLIQGSYVLIAGWVLTLVYHWTENLAVPIVMHALFNFIGSGWLIRWTGADERAETIFVYVLYGCIALAVVSLYFLRRHHRARVQARGEAM